MVISNAVYGDAITEGRAGLIDRIQYFGTSGLSVAIAIRKDAGATDRLADIFVRAIKEKSGHGEGSP